MSGLRWADSAQAAPATAIGTIGAVGQGFSVSERPWACSQCKGENLARRLVRFGLALICVLHCN
jgi:hypothetical protein